MEADAYLEPDRLERAGSHGDGEVFHLLPAGSVLVVVTGALIDEERDDDIGVNCTAHRHHLRLAVADHDVHVGAGSAERLRTYRSSALDVCLAHGGPFFLTSDGWMVLRRSLAAARWRMFYGEDYAADRGSTREKTQIGGLLFCR